MLAYTAFKKHFREDDLDISYISKKNHLCYWPRPVKDGAEKIVQN